MGRRSSKDQSLDVEPVGASREVSPEEQANDQHDSRASFPIVGIGASAGGFEALEQFLGHVPDGSGMAFVIVQHLDPTRKGIMPELLQRDTTMQVIQVKEQQHVEPNHVYVIPPNKDMSILHGVLHLMKPMAPRGLRLPIDSFLRSLAEDMQHAAVGVILSGMGSDGTLGLRAIKENAGLALVQDPVSAKFDGMPRSAIDAGLADIVAPAEELPEKIIAYLRQVSPASITEFAATDRAQSGLENIIVLLRSHTGHDFFHYKKSTLYRRIERRMGVHQIGKIGHYVRYLQENPCELDLLFKELLIGVTSFFRDPEEWDRLRDIAIPALVTSGQPGRELRAWVVGCSTGEEAYSLAIVFKEAMERTKPKERFTLQIFATDLDRDAIDRARHAVYPANISANVSPERLRRFFAEQQGSYRVNKEIREMVIFAPQNVIKDPPFTKLDIVSCRNLLIYMEQDLQKTVLRLLHYSLMPDGILLLGSSETVGSCGDLFESLGGKSRLNKRLEPNVQLEPVEFPHPFVPPPVGPPPQHDKLDAVASIQSLADQLLLQSYSPAAVLVNNKGDVIYISGRTGKYLEPAAGKANWNIFVMTREGLRYELIEAFQKALHQKKKVILSNMTVETDGGTQTVDVAVEVIEKPEELRGMVMIVFADVDPAPEPAVTSGVKRAARNHSRLAQTESELRHTREELHGVREEMQSSQEELRSANEELQSTNEELQSTNEELTTSREEMQSLNEELQTVNNELQAKLDELSRTSDDLNNLFNSTDIATVFLDSKLVVRRFTSEAKSVFRLIPGDVGRPVTDIASDLLYPELPDDAVEVLQTLLVKAKQVPTRDGRWFAVRIMPYRTLANKIDGLVVTLMDITSSKTLEAELRQTAGRINNILESTSDAYFSLDNDLRVTYFNSVAEQVLNRKSKAVLGNYLFDVFPEARGSILEDRYRQALRDGTPLSFETNFTVEPFAGWYNVRVYPEAEGISVYFQVKTPLKQAKDELRECERRLRAATKPNEDSTP